MTPTISRRLIWPWRARDRFAVRTYVGAVVGDRSRRGSVEFCHTIVRELAFRLDCRRRRQTCLSWLTLFTAFAEDGESRMPEPVADVRSQWSIRPLFFGLHRDQFV